MIKVSVIVPVFNAGELLRSCIDSIIEQSLREIEIILVDDGSTDNSLDILREYEQKDSRVQVLTQRNLFAGVARNNGLNAASGEYVIFWDSDDYFNETALEALYNEAKRCEADICVGEAVKFDAETGEEYKGSRYIRKNLLPERRPFNRLDIPCYIFNYTNNSPWNKLYRRAFIEKEGLRFKDSKRANDMYFVMAASVLAEKITTVDVVIVYYRFLNKNSLSSCAADNGKYIIRAYREVQDLLKEKGFWENDEIRLSFVNKLYSSVHVQFTYTRSYEEFISLARYYKEELSELQLGETTEEKFLPKKHYREFQTLMSGTAEQFLFDLYCIDREQTKIYMNKFLEERDKLKKEKKKNNSIKTSKSYRIGRVLTGPARLFNRGTKG